MNFFKKLLKKKIIFSIVAFNAAIFFYCYLTQVYPIPLVVLNLISILILWRLSVRGLHLLSRSNLQDIFIIVLILVVSVLIRLYKIEIITSGMWGDEITVGRVAERVLRSSQFIPFVSDNYGHATPLLYLTGLAIKIFGRSLTSIRLVSVILELWTYPYFMYF